MTEQWFLDLDGVRSGPYHTNEVLSLITDGEVLPHHRIARGLKDPAWQTILDWRKGQALKPTTAIPPPKPSPPAPSSTPPASRSLSQDEPPPPSPAPSREEFLKEIEEMERTLSKLPDEPVKRDPMAEMFDILQNTRQKREAKQIQSAQAQAHAHPPREIPSDKVFISRKFIAFCIGLALIGLGLGQLVQNIAPPAPKTATAPKAEAKASVKTEVVDRSNEKMTIRAVVEKKNEPAPTPVQVKPAIPVARSGSHPASSATKDPDSASERKSEKEIEELRDLKKELQELKALKEQLKDAPLSEEFGDSADLLPAQDALNPPEYPNSANPKPQGSPAQGDFHY